jgi:hypothetical protein
MFVRFAQLTQIYKLTSKRIIFESMLPRTENILIPSKAYNLKLPRHLKSRFTRPFDKFLTNLLTYTPSLTSEDMNASMSEEIHCRSDWLVWLHVEDRDKFQTLKKAKMPKETNARFIMALLLVRDRVEAIESYNMIPSDLPAGTKAGHLISNRREIQRMASYKIYGTELLT